MVWSHLFFYHLLSAVALYCLLSSDVWCHLFKVVMQHFPLFCPQFPSRGEVTQQQQQADHCSTTMGQYWGDQCTAIWWNQTHRIPNSSSSEGWNYQVDKQDKNFPDLDQITEELFHTVPLEQCSSVVPHCGEGSTFVQNILSWQRLRWAFGKRSQEYDESASESYDPRTVCKGKTSTRAIWRLCVTWENLYDAALVCKFKILLCVRDVSWSSSRAVFWNSILSLRGSTLWILCGILKKWSSTAK